MACNILSYPINEEKGGSKIYCERQSKNNSQLAISSSKLLEELCLCFQVHEIPDILKYSSRQLISVLNQKQHRCP